MKTHYTNNADPKTPLPPNLRAFVDAVRASSPNSSVEASPDGARIDGRMLPGHAGKAVAALVRSGEPITGATLRLLTMSGLLWRVRVQTDAGSDRVVFTGYDGRDVHARSLEELVRRDLEAQYATANVKGAALVFPTSAGKTNAVLEDGHDHRIDRLAEKLVRPGDLLRCFLVERPSRPWVDRAGNERTTRCHLVPLPFDAADAWSQPAPLSPGASRALLQGGAPVALPNLGA